MVGGVMAYFAELDNTNTVIRVISVSNDVCGEPTLGFPDTDAAGRAFIANTLKLEGVWKQTSYNANFRGVYAGIGYTYDADLDEFVAPPEPDPIEA
jgi:phage shock protein PspC (stress-responsive transcriptional regulator)